MTIQERLEDTETALHIAQVDRDKWKARAIKLAKVLGIKDCDIDDFNPQNMTNGDVIEAMFPNIEWTGNCQDVDFYMLDGETPYSAKLNTFISWWNSPYKKEGDEE